MPERRQRRPRAPGRSLSSAHGSVDGAHRERPGRHQHLGRRPGRAAAGGGAGACSTGGAGAQLVGGQHRLVVLLLVLHDHAEDEPVGDQRPPGRTRRRVEQVEHLVAAPCADVGAGLGRGEQRQRRAGRARGCSNASYRSSISGRTGVAAADVAQQPQLLLVADVREVPDQRRHQRRVLRDQVGLVDRVGQQRRCGRGRGRAPRRSGCAAASRRRDRPVDGRVGRVRSRRRLLPASSAGRTVRRADEPVGRWRTGSVATSRVARPLEVGQPGGAGRARRRTPDGRRGAAPRSARPCRAAATQRCAAGRGDVARRVDRARVGEQRGQHRERAAPTAGRAARRGSAPPGSRAGAPAGTAWSGGSRGRRWWAGGAAPPSTQSANVTPSRHRPAGRRRRTQSSGASSTQRAQAAAGSPGLRVDGRRGARRVERAATRPCRADVQPVRRPCRRGELANAASSTGPSACSAAQRSATLGAAPRRRGRPGGRRWCTSSLRPAGPLPVERLLHRAVARQLQHGAAAARSGRAARASTTRPARGERGGAARRRRRRRWRPAAGEVGSGGLASSIWPPGSTVTCEPPGSGSAGDDGSRAAGVPAQRGAQSRGVDRSGRGGRGRTSHSSSTPVSIGGPCLKHTDAT